MGPKQQKRKATTSNSGPSIDVPYNLLSELKTGNQDWNIKARITRMWDVLNIKNNDELMSVDLILLDEEDTHIHAVINRKFVEYFKDTIEEGKVYSISKFQVSRAKNVFRVLITHDYMIYFDEATIIRHVHDFEHIPRHKFEFVRFTELDALANKGLRLPDVSGYIVGSTPLGDRFVNGKITKHREIELQVSNSNSVRINFWGRLTEMIGDNLCSVGNSAPFVVVTSNNVKTFQESLSLSATSATKVYTKLNLPGLRTFQISPGTKIEDLKSPKRSVDPEEIPKLTRTIDEIYKYIQDEPKQLKTFFCTCTINGINTSQGWYYVGCDKCSTKLEPLGSKHWCNTCPKECDLPKLMYRIELEVVDHTGKAIFVLFDREGKKLIHQPVSALANVVKDKVGDSAPEEIVKAFVGKTFNFQIQLTKFNWNQFKPTFTVSKVLDEVDSKTQHETKTKNGTSAIIVDLENDENMAAYKKEIKIKQEPDSEEDQKLPMIPKSKAAKSKESDAGKTTRGKQKTMEMGDNEKLISYKKRGKKKVMNDFEDKEINLSSSHKVVENLLTPPKVVETPLKRTRRQVVQPKKLLNFELTPGKKTKTKATQAGEPKRRRLQRKLNDEEDNTSIEMDEDAIDSGTELLERTSKRCRTVILENTDSEDNSEDINSME